MRRIERRAPSPDGRVCAFTGHRPSKYAFLADPGSAGYRLLKEKLGRSVDAAVREGFTHFVCGGALGVDTMAALLILEKRSADPTYRLRRRPVSARSVRRTFPLALRRSVGE